MDKGTPFYIAGGLVIIALVFILGLMIGRQQGRASALGTDKTCSEKVIGRSVYKSCN